MRHAQGAVLLQRGLLALPLSTIASPHQYYFVIYCIAPPPAVCQACNDATERHTPGTVIQLANSGQLFRFSLGGTLLMN